MGILQLIPFQFPQFCVDFCHCLEVQKQEKGIDSDLEDFVVSKVNEA